MTPTLVRTVHRPSADTSTRYNRPFSVRVDVLLILQWSDRALVISNLVMNRKKYDSQSPAFAVKLYSGDVPDSADHGGCDHSDEHSQFRD